MHMDIFWVCGSMPPYRNHICILKSHLHCHVYNNVYNNQEIKIMCPLIDEREKTILYTYTMKCYSMIKKIGKIILSLSSSWNGRSLLNQMDQV